MVNPAIESTNPEEELFYKLLHAEDESDVIQILDDQGYSMSNEHVWVPLGNNPGNFSTVGNQQENPSAALIEKLTNSIDAVLVSECHGTGVDPESEHAPTTMQDAVEQFLGVKEGRMDYLSETLKPCLCMAPLSRSSVAPLGRSSTNDHPRCETAIDAMVMCRWGIY